MPNIPLISVVSPVYRGEKMINALVGRCKTNLELITSDYEIILVNDCSPDDSWVEITEECKKDYRIKGIDLSKNFGQHYAITAGISYAQGEWVVVMDCDLQDRPEEIPALYSKAKEGYDTVLAQRVQRVDGFFKKNTSKLFYKLFSYLTETKQDASVANFGIYNKSVIQSVLAMGDQIRYFPTMVQWVGYKKAYLPIEHGQRMEGKSSYNFKKLFRLAMDTIIAFSDKPLRLAAKFGLLVAFFAFMVGLVYFVLYFSGVIKVLGFASTIISVWLLGGIIIFLCGVLGIYLGKVFEKVKDRPKFIIWHKVNL